MTASTTALISKIALVFSADEELDVQIDRTLELVGSGLGASRAFLFVDTEDGTAAKMTHEWCAPGIESRAADSSYELPYAQMPSLKDVLSASEVCAYQDIALLPSDLVEALEPHGIRSGVMAGMRVQGAVRGFLGLDECRQFRDWSAEETETLCGAVSMVATAYSRKLLTQRLTASEENFRTYFNTVSDMIFVGDSEWRIVFANEGARRRLGYALSELCGMPLAELHPPDQREQAQVFLGQMIARERDDCPLELWTKSGQRVPVATRVWFGEWDGAECLFAVSKDLSDERAALGKFEKLFESNPAAISVTTVDDGRFVQVNEAFLDLLGYSREEVVGRSSEELGLHVDTEFSATASEEMRATGKIGNREVVVRRKDGGLVYGQFSSDIIENQGVKYFLTVMVDVTEQVELRRELEAESLRLTNIVEGTRLGTWEWDVATGRTVINGRWAEIVGYTLSELQPTTIETGNRLVHPDDRAESDRRLQRHFSGQAPFYECEVRMRHKNGSWVWVLDRGKVLERGAEGAPLTMYGTHADITEQKELERQIRELAIRDPLTGAYNRRYVLERLDGIVAEYARRGRNFSLAVLDIDHFKEVNDTHGHLAGDQVLRDFFELLACQMRPYDLLGRYGGEEFLIVSPSTDGAECCAMVERALGVVRAHLFQFSGGEVHLTFSGGIADSWEVPRGAVSTQQLIGMADLRLYEAKAGGRGRVICVDAR